MTLTPRLEIFTDRIEQNARAIINLCHRNGIKVACVTKVTLAHPEVVKALERAGADMLADSRLENLQAIRRSGTQLPLMRLRIPTPSRANEVITTADISLVSSIESTQALSIAATSMGLTHQVILMIDIGDLREGIWPDHAVEVVNATIKLPNLELIGLGSNLACFGGVIPTSKKMQMLIDLRDECVRATGFPLPVICGGNSANLPMLANNTMPEGINLLRIGETILLGRNVIDRSPWPGTRQDTFRLVAEIVELEKKPSMPIGLRGQDAFGGNPRFEDRGIRKRAIVNIGRQDATIENIQPEDKGIIVLGGSSDHLILDVEESSRKLSPGDEVAFQLGYSALLAANTSPFVQKIIVKD